MKVSVVIACLNEEKNIGACLDSLIAIDFPKEDLEVIISDGGSTDRTREIVAGYQKNHPYIRMSSAPKRWTSTVRNFGVEATSYDYIAFVDADCEVPKEWLKILTERFVQYDKSVEKLAAVGGANILPEKAEGFPKALGIVLDSYLGSLGSIQGLILSEPAEVKSLSTVNALYIKSALLSVNCFDESLLDQGEDADINFRLRQAGYRFIFIPESFVWHKMRPTPQKWLKNMFRYGKARARLLKRYPEMRTVGYALPLLFLAGIALIPFGFWWGPGFLPLGYFVILFIYSCFKCQKKQALNLIWPVYSGYLLTHFGYAAGELYGLLTSKVK